MLLARLDDDLDVADLLDLLGEHRAQLLANLRRDAARAAIRDQAVRIQRAEIRARRHIAGLQFQPETERLDHAAAHLKLERIITKQRQMPRPAARRDARRHRNHAPLRGPARDERVEIRRVCGFERRHLALTERGDVAEAIQHHERELGVRFESQFGIKIVEFHGSVSCSVSTSGKIRGPGETARGFADGG